MHNRLTQVRIRNFRSVAGPAEIDLAPITMLYGPNSAGKSAVAAVIDLVGRLCLRGDPSPAEIEDLLRSMRNRDYSQTMDIGLTGRFHVLQGHALPGTAGIQDLRRRDSGYPEPPPQSRTCGFPASGSSVVLAFA